MTATTDHQLIDDEILVGVMGPTGSGKSTFINLLSGSDLRIGEGLEACTAEVQRSLPFELDGKRVVLVDTPGFDDTAKSDAEILGLVVDYIAELYKSKKNLAGVLYFHRISDFRVGGIAKRNIEVFHELCGEALPNALIVTNMWGEVTSERGERREHQLRTDNKFFAPTINAGAHMFRHQNTRDSAEAIVREIIHKVPQVLKIQREIVDEKLSLAETAAGGVLFRDLKAQEEKHKKEQEEMKQEMETANATVKEELKQEIQRQEAELVRVQEEMEKLRRNQARERKEQERLREKQPTQTPTRHGVEGMQMDQGMDVKGEVSVPYGADGHREHAKATKDIRIGSGARSGNLGGDTDRVNGQRGKAEA